jgi:hypothetical protein
MTYFSLLSAVKKHLEQNVKSMTFHLTHEPHNDPPCCVVELEDRSPFMEGYGIEKGMFRTTCFHQEVGVKNALDHAQHIRQVLDGAVLNLKEGKLAVVKHTGNRVEISQEGQNKTISHLYEALIRRT